MKRLLLATIESFMLFGCEPPPRERMRVVDGHVYLWVSGFSQWQYVHDPNCPKCAEMLLESEK